MRKLYYEKDIIPPNFTGVIEYRTGTKTKVVNGIFIDIESLYYLKHWCDRMNEVLSPKVYT